MHTIHLVLLAGALLISTGLARAGSYPPGSAIQSFSYADGTVDLGDGTTIGADPAPGVTGPVAGVFANRLRLVGAGMTNVVGSFKLPDLDPDTVLRSFDLKVGVVMEPPASGGTGEGWALSFGRIPRDHGTGEGGFVPIPGGLTLAFDTFDNGGDAPSITVSVGGVAVGNFPQTFTHDTSDRTLVVHWDALGLDVSYAGKVICVDLPVPGFSPGVGNTFAFTARTTETRMGVSLVGLKVTTQALPVVETGGPIISEFVANNGELEDEFADKPGWIELLNGSAVSVDLAGWYLTDSKSNLTKWRISALTLPPYSYRVVFASGKDRQLAPANFVHASFTLAKSGGFVALVKPDGRTLASAYEYGPQDRNVAFGEKGSERKIGYLHPTTPGNVNTAEPAPASFAPAVEFSHAGGFLSAPVTLALSISRALAGAEIRYTTNRTEPGPASLLYREPIGISALTMVRARVFAPGHLPGPVSSRTFVRMDATLADFGGPGKPFVSNLPLIFLESFGVGIDSSSGGVNPFRPTFAVVIAPDPATGRASLVQSPEYAGPAGVHVRGESSVGFDQKSYALEFQDEAARDRDVGVLGLPADSDWVLYGPWSEKTMMRNKLVFDWMRAVRGPDGMAVRTRFVELFFNQSRAANGQVGYGSYRGVYVLMEKLKRGKDRVPIENLNTNTVDPELITGGYIVRQDKVDSFKNSWTTTRFGLPLQSFDPDRFNTNQLGYVRSYINAFEVALGGANFRNATNGYRAFIDPDTFIDAQWMLEIAKQVDGYVFSTYFHKDRAGRLRAGPLWDFNISLGNADYATGETPTGWLYDVANGAGQNWYPRLHADPDYKLAHWDRYWHIRRGVLATETVLASIDAHATNLLDGYSLPVTNRMPFEVQNPVARHFRRWQRLGVRDWPNPAISARIRTWQGEVDYLKTWLKTRLEWLDDQSMRSGKTVYRPPMLSHSGGPIHAPITLSMAPFQRVPPTNQYPEGTIYYTLDNSDPRLPGGEIRSSAMPYSRPLHIDSSATVRARLYSQKNWSPLAVATYLVRAVPAAAGNLVVSEIMYRPAPLTPVDTLAGIVDAQAFEFLELRNIARQTIDLSGVRLSNGVDFEFAFAPEASRLLRPGESVVLVADTRAFTFRHRGVPVGRIAGQFRGHLDSGGEALTVRSAHGEVIQDFRYDDDAPWPGSGAGAGRSIVLSQPASDPRPGQPSSWVVSARVGGTPGESGTGSDTFAGDPALDTDGDGVPDLFEFASGSDPENPGSSFAPTASIAAFQPGGVTADYFRFEIRRRPGLRNVRLVFESSRNLTAWEAPENALVLESTRQNPDDTVTETYRGRTPISDPATRPAFFRVRAVRF